MKPHAKRARRDSSLLLRLATGSVTMGLIATGLSGCDHARIPDEVHPRLTENKRRHPITVLAETATLDIAVPAQGKGSDARVYVEATRFLRNYRHEGRGPLIIAVPRSSGAGQRVQVVRAAAYRNGIAPERIRVVSKPGHGSVTLSYDRIAAVGPTCGDWSEDVSRNRENLPYPNFGCATQRNLAAMTANPTDLMYPANEAPRGSDTRAADQKNFNQGIGKSIPNAGGTGTR